MQSIGIWMIVGLFLAASADDNAGSGTGGTGGKSATGDGQAVTRAEDRSYATAFAEAQQAKRPLVVIVTATWCPPCQVLKNKVLKPLEAKHGFDNVVLAYVDMDKEPALAKQLVGSQGIPQLIVYEKDADKWVKRNLTGFQELATVEEFIKPKFGEVGPIRMVDAGVGRLQR
jgi:thiol:disulfide interchange protein